MKKRAFVRYSKKGKLVPGSLIITNGSYPDGPSLWLEIPADICCTTTTTTFIPVSDTALKQNIVATGNKIGQFNEYTWEWNEIAKNLGVDDNPKIGVLAQEVMETMPEAVVYDASIGYYRVNYNIINNG